MADTEATTDTGTDGTSDDDPADGSSSGGLACAVPCGEGETCVDGGCVVVAACGAQLTDPQCTACVENNCCADVEACFAGGARTSSACAQLFSCAEAQCLEAASEAEYLACLNEQCAEHAAELERLSAALLCVTECLVVTPGTEDSCWVLGPADG